MCSQEIGVKEITDKEFEKQLQNKTLMKLLS